MSNSIQNIPIISKISLFLLENISFNEIPDSVSILESDITFSDDFENVTLKHTIGSASFVEKSEETAAGSLFTKKLEFKYPQLNSVHSNEIEALRRKTLGALITDPNGITLLSYPLKLESESKNNGSGTGFRGNILTLTGIWKKQSLFVI